MSGLRSQEKGSVQFQGAVLTCGKPVWPPNQCWTPLRRSCSPRSSRGTNLSPEWCTADSHQRPKRRRSRRGLILQCAIAWNGQICRSDHVTDTSFKDSYQWIIHILYASSGAVYTYHLACEDCHQPICDLTREHHNSGIPAKPLVRALAQVRDCVIGKRQSLCSGYLGARPICCKKRSRYVNQQADVMSFSMWPTP